jgi:hypothetical protein
MLALRPPVPAERSAEAREKAASLVSVLAADFPDLLQFGGIDLRPATEQTLFHHFRLDRGSQARDAASRLRPLARLAFAGSSALAQWRLPVVQGKVVALLLNPTHLDIMRPIEAALVRDGGPSVVHVSDGLPAARRHRVPRLSAFLDRSWIGALAQRYREVNDAQRAIAQRAAAIVDGQAAEVVARLAGADLHRQVLMVASLSSVVRRDPCLILTFDELGRRARLMGPVAAQARVPSLDLPHAEAADPYAITGASYDMFGVFGPRARGVLRQAGIPESKIREVGPARFDALVERPTARPVTPRRVVFAAQWLGGQMTAEVKTRTIRIALQASGAVAPCEFVVVPHPLERDSIADELLAREQIAGVMVHVERTKSLYEVLDGAWALVTGWSNSVFEGLLARVPTICVTVTEMEPPTTFVEDGLALGATSTAEASEALISFLEPEHRTRFVRQAREALVEHVGPLDGRAATRSAALITELARFGPSGSPG